MLLEEHFTLSNGNTIPKLGFGTWLIEDDVAAQTVKTALEIGYRHIDSAQGYGNERGVGEGIRNSNVPREEIFVTTKLEADIKNYEDAVLAIDNSLEKMDLGYIDLFIIHSPQPWAEFREEKPFFEENLAIWKALEEAYKEGKVRAIGLSNFEERDIQNILDHGTVKPVVNQILAHISNTPFDLIKYCQENEILVEAYSPIGHGALLNHPILIEMAEKYNVTVPQLAIRYCLELGMLPIAKSSNPKHIESNASVDFEISSDDLETLKTIETIENYGEANKFHVYGKGISK